MNQEKIGKFIANMRKEKNLTQEQLSEKLGVSNKSISRWENGKSMPDLSMFPILSKELGVSINDLMSGERLDKTIYQEKFEENMIHSIDEVEHKNNRRCYFMLVISIIILIFIISYVTLNSICFPLSYDEDKMYIEDSEYGLRFANKNLCTLYSSDIKQTTTSVYIENEEVGIIFVSASCSIMDHYQYYKEGGTSYRWYYIQFPEDNFPDKYKIYYVKQKVNNLKNLEEKELLDTIQKSYLLYEN